MISFAQCSYLAQVARLRKLAQNALAQFDVAVCSLTLIAHWNNTTFDVCDTKGQRYVLRIGRPGFQGYENVQSEVAWLDLIGQKTDLCVPEVVKSREGNGVVWAGGEGIEEDRVCVMFRRRRGVFYDAGLTPQHYEKAGVLMGQLHGFAQTSSVPDRFVRKRWTVATATGCVNAVDQSAFQKLLRVGDQAIYDAVWQWYEDVWHDLGQSCDVFGVIHGDFHPRNILFLPDGVGAIDFDECGWGHYLHDVAVTMMGIRKHKTYEALRASFLEGYTRVCTLPKGWERYLPAFEAGRLLGLAVWTAGVTDHPWNRSQAPKVVLETMDVLKEMLKKYDR